MNESTVDKYRVGMILPYKPSNDTFQKAGLLEVSGDITFETTTTATERQKALKVHGKGLIDAWIELAKDIEDSDYISQRMGLRVMENDKKPITGEEVEEVKRDELEKEPSTPQHTDSQPHSNGNGRRQPTEIPVLIQSTVRGEFMMCPCCLNDGVKTNIHQDSDINYGIERWIPIGMCINHRADWFASKDKPDARKVLREHYMSIMSELAGKDGFGERLIGKK